MCEVCEVCEVCECVCVCTCMRVRVRVTPVFASVSHIAAHTLAYTAYSTM